MSPEIQNRRRHEKRVELLLRRVDNSRWPAAGATLILFFLFLPDLGAMAAGSWAAAMILAYGLRDLLVLRAVRQPFKRSQEYPPEADDVISWSSASLTFVINYPAAFFLPAMDALLGSLYVVIMVGWMLIAVHIIGIHTRSYLMYVAVAFSYLTIGWWQMYEPSIAIFATLSLVGAGWILVTYSRNTAAVFEESVRIAHTKDAALEALQGTFTKAAVAQRERSQSLAETAHDILQPAQALVLLLSVLRKNSSEEIRQQALESTEATADSVVSMFRGLLDLARLDGDAVREPFSACSLTPILRSIEAAYAPTCLSRNIDLEVVCPESLKAQGGSEMIERVLWNLVDNAVKYTGSDGAVTVRGAEAGHQIEVCIEDTGPGIPREEQARVLEPFYRSKTAPREVEGVGLGLTNSARFVELMGGELAIESETGRGAKVSVRLPIGTDTGPTEPPAPPLSTERRPVAERNVLLLEDSLQAQVALTLCLLNNDAEVAPASTVEEAVALIDGGFVPDMLLVDLHLGANLNGIECIPVLREKAGDIPVVLTTASLFEVGRLPANVRLLRKPFKDNQLIELMEYGFQS